MDTIWTPTENLWRRQGLQPVQVLPSDMVVSSRDKPAGLVL